MVRAQDFDENRSLWAATRPAPQPCPPLERKVQADVVVIGGGFTGVSSAYHIARRHPEKKIVLLEARTVGSGASGRNGGLVLNWVNGVDTEDEVSTRRIWDTTQRGIAVIDAMIRDNNLDVRFRRDGALEVLTNPQRAEQAMRQVETLRSWGIPVEWLEGDALRERLDMAGVHGAILDPTCGQLHGLDLLYGMKGVLLRLGVDIYENTPAIKVEEGRTVTVTTPQGEVAAAATVLATNAWSPSLGYFRAGMVPLISHVISLGPLPDAEWARLGWKRAAGFFDDMDRVAYGSLLPDGELVFGGGSNASYDYVYGSRTVHPASPEVPAQATAAIHDLLLRYFPGMKDVPIARAWSGPVGITLSRICSVGVRGSHHNVFYGVGYSGHGIALTHLTGEILADLYDGQGARWQDLPFIGAPLAGIPPEPFKWIGYQLFTRLTGKAPRKRR